jgi:putative hydrolase of the HAD superfamily
MPIRAVLFDFGGVLMNMRWDVVRDLELEHRLPSGALVRTLYGIEIWRQLEIGIGTREAWLAEAHRELEAVAGAALPPLHERWRASWLPIDANVQLAGRLRPPYLTGVLSNADSTLVERLKQMDGVFDSFDDVLCSADVGLAKPDRRIYALAARRLGVEADECVFVDDSERNVDAALQAGMAAVHFVVDRGDALEELLAGAGVRAEVPA